jgi:hypothetical protein
MRISILFLLFIPYLNVDGQIQKNYPLGKTNQPDTLQFNDTIFGYGTNGEKSKWIIIRSEPTYNWFQSPMINCRGRFYFKIQGSESAMIQRSFTSDPHFIDCYPKLELTTDSIYYFDVAFSFGSRPGRYQKSMGFEMINGDRFTMKFKGEVLNRP